MKEYLIKDTCIINEGKKDLWGCIGKERED